MLPIKSKRDLKKEDTWTKWTTVVSAGDVKKGDIVLLKGRPCQIVNIAVSK